MANLFGGMTLFPPRTCFRVISCPQGKVVKFAKLREVVLASKQPFNVIKASVFPSLWLFPALDTNAQSDFEGSPLTHFTPFPTTQSAGVNVFAQNPLAWKKKENPYLCPPFSLIGPILKFLLHTGISFTIVMPNMPVKLFWWPILFSAASDQFVFCKKEDLHAVLFPQRGGGFQLVPSSVELWVFRVHI